MMAKTCQAQDGAIITDGEAAELVLLHGETERRVSGIVHVFEQHERVYDEEHIAVGKTSEFHWEILTGDPQYPAIGFLPENVLTLIGN